MAYDIGPRIGIQGEAEFNRQIKNINNALKECGSEMKALSSEFDENANSQDALVAKNKNLQKELDLQRQKMGLLEGQYEKQVQKLEELRNAYQQTAAESGKTSKEAQKAENAFNKQADEVSKLGVAMNETQNYINQLNNSISKNDRMLDEIESGARDAATGLSTLADEADDASDSLDNIEKNTRAEALSSLADGFSSAGDAMKGMVEDSKEYLSIMGQLKSSSEDAGYSAEETKNTYMQLYEVLGDDQTAATTTANLQALGLSQNDLTRMTEIAIGAWSKYGDSIPIDSLAEGINETAQQGVVVGAMADALNWAGESEDSFNEKLANTSSEAERANLIMQTLSDIGLEGIAKDFRNNNEGLIAYNRSQQKFNDAMSNVAIIIMPAVTNAMNLAADAINAVVGFIGSMPEPVQKVISVIGVLVVAIGALVPVILMGVSAFTTLSGSLTTTAVSSAAAGTAATGAATGFGAMSASLLPLIGVLALIVVAILAVIPAIQQLWNENEEFRNQVETIWGQIQSLIKTATDLIQQIIAAFVELAKAIWNEWGDDIMNVVSYVMNFISDLIENGLNIIKNVINLFTSILKGDWSGAWDAVKNILNSVLEIIKSLVRNAFGALGSIIAGVGSTIGNAVQSAFSAAINFITSLPGKAIQWGRDFINGLADGIMSGVNKIVNSVKDIANKIRSFLHFSRPDEGPLRDYEKWMPDFITGLANGIYNNLDEVEKAASAVSGTIDSTITGKVADMSTPTAMRSTVIKVDGDTMILDGKIVGKTAAKYINVQQAGNAAAKGQRPRYV